MPITMKTESHKPNYLEVIPPLVSFNVHHYLAIYGVDPAANIKIRWITTVTIWEGLHTDNFVTPKDLVASNIIVNQVNTTNWIICEANGLLRYLTNQSPDSNHSHERRPIRGLYSSPMGKQNQPNPVATNY